MPPEQARLPGRGLRPHDPYRDKVDHLEMEEVANLARLKLANLSESLDRALERPPA